MNIYHVSFVSFHDTEHETRTITPSVNQALAACQYVIETIRSNGYLCVDTWKDGELSESFSWPNVGTEIEMIEKYLERIHAES